MRTWFWEGYALVKESILAFVEDNALSHGAAMAFYAATSLAPILLIVVAIAGIAFGHEAAKLALSAQISGLMGSQSADLLREALQSASAMTTGMLATVTGLVTLFLTASGVFGEMQSALNSIWKVEPHGTSVSRLVRARAASLGLVAALGFLLLVSLAVSAAISSMSDMINARLPLGTVVLATINTTISFVLIAAMFAAIYKILPDRRLEWRDVIVGSMVTAALFTLGKSLIGWYIGTSEIASSYGAAGGLLVILLWVYYSSQIFLFGAELTRAYSARHGSWARPPSPLSVPPQHMAIGIAPTRKAAGDLGRMTLLAAAWTLGALAARMWRSKRQSGRP